MLQHLIIIGTKLYKTMTTCDEDIVNSLKTPKWHIIQMKLK